MVNEQAEKNKYAESIFVRAEELNDEIYYVACTDAAEFVTEAKGGERVTIAIYVLDRITTVRKGIFIGNDHE